MKKVALIHALEASIKPIRSSFERLWPEAVTVNILDDSLSRDLAKVGVLNNSFADRMTVLVKYAIETGVEGILFTCSAFGTAIEVARAGHDMPILKPDEAMISQALETSKSIGVLVTFLPTVASIRREIQEIADLMKVEQPEILFCFVEGAIEALNSGDLVKHDELIIKQSMQLIDCDLIILAQFSMAHLVNEVIGATKTNAIGSPDPAVLFLKNKLENTLLREK